MSEIITRSGPGKGDRGLHTEVGNANCVTLFMPSNKLEDLLKPSKDGDLGSLISRARQMGELTSVLCSSLPESDRSAIVAANVREDGELVIICASSAWASRLRYETDSLLQAARDAGFTAQTCRVRVTQN